jgi:hypothetical protein
MNIYLKNFGLYLGGALAATYLFSFFTHTAFLLGFVVVIAGTVLVFLQQIFCAILGYGRASHTNSARPRPWIRTMQS